MRKRDRIRAFFSPDTASPVPSRRASPLLAQPAPISPSSSAPSLFGLNINAAVTKSRTPAFEKALAIHLDKIPEVERAAFAHASGTIDEQNLLSDVRAYDELHKNDSSFRTHAERLSKFLGLLDRFMGGVAIGIQANPEVSSLVVGAVRIVINLALNFTTFFSRLADMICAFEDYLGPLEAYIHVADVDPVEKMVVKIYGNILDLCWKARRVFLDVNGNRRRWTSVRAFMRQHWESFESEFESIQEDMRHHLDVLLHSVQALHYDASREAEKVRRCDEEKKEKSAFLSWVSCIDFEKAHQDTYAKKHKQTCRWLIGEPKYQEWYNSPVSSLLWCYGKPGIGKSVLASNVLEHITTENELREDTAICFAYYNYRDSQLSDISQIIAALVKQLCRRRNHIPPDLLQVKQKALPPSLVGTQEIFISLVEGLSQVYLVFDALDECPEQERQDILGFITSLVTVQIRGRIKVFVTSRKEMDIAAAFEEKNIPTIQISAENVATDIENFTRSQVEKLRKGEHGKMLYITNDDLKERIIQTLSTKAEGMFLWVNLQLDSLCQFSKAKKTELVEDALKALPQGLPSTYIRILERIESQIPYMKDLAQRSLAWTLYAQRPLSMEELQIALAIKSDCKNLKDLRLDSPQVILEACGNLLEENHGTIRLIHYTVQEFLSETTQGISQSLIKQQLSDPSLIHAQLSLACLIYIQLTAFCDPVQYQWDLYHRLEKNKFSVYAYKYFDHHIVQCDDSHHDIMVRLGEIFEQGTPCLAAIMQIKVLGDEIVWESIRQRFNPMSIPISASTVVYGTRLYDVPIIREQWAVGIVPEYALHFACSAGLFSAVTRLLEGGYDASEEDGNGITALYYASLEESWEIVRQLLKHNVNIGAQGGYYGNALQAASSKGSETVAKLLLEKGAIVNAEGGYFGNALQAASAGGHEAVAKLLLDKGASVNAEGGYFGNALQAASAGGYKAVIKLLLDKGASVNAEGGQYSSALQAASAGGHEAVMNLLLNRGASVNVEGGYFGNALQAASSQGSETAVKLLLEKGAIINAEGGYFGNALQAASAGGHEAVVKLLLDKGAIVNTEGGLYGNALQAASSQGSETVTKLLLDKGAVVDAEGGRYGSALQAALYGGHKAVVNLLLEKGASVNAEGGCFGNTLQAASAGGHKTVVKLLLEKGASVNAEGGYFGNALEAASARGHEVVAKLLLDKGANVNAEGGYFGNALQAASAGGHEAVAKLLLEKGASVNAKSGRYGNALYAASHRGYKAVVKLLLNRGASVNAEGGYFGNALQAASAGGHKAVAKLLLDKGANVNAEGGHYRNALYAACRENERAIVELLIEKGADLKVIDHDGRTPLNTAADSGHLEVVELLIEKGADLTVASNNGVMPLNAAASNGHLEVAKLLIEKGADLAAATNDGWTPLDFAASNDHLETVELLLKKGLDFSSPNVLYGSPLNLLALKGYTDLVRFSCEQGRGDPRAADTHGRAAIHLAARGEHLDTFLYLLGLDLGNLANDPKGDQLLSYASSGGSLDIVQKVIKDFPKPSSQHNHWSPLHWACRAGKADVVEELIREGFCSHHITTSQPLGSWDPASVAIFHGNEHILSLLPTKYRPLLSSRGGTVRVVGEKHGGYWCNGCFHDIYGPRFHCRTCLDLDYCFMCRPFLDYIHVDHEWDCIESY